MKKVLLIFFVLFMTLPFVNTTQAQMQGIFERHVTEARKPIPYQFVREADVMWSKVIWRRVVLTEKMNLPLYYPTKKMDGRKSLIQLMMWGIVNKSLTPFSSDEFSSQYTASEIDERFDATTDTTYDIDPETGRSIPIISKRKADYGEVKEILIKEMWFFDKQRSVMEVRVIGIAPIRLYFRDNDIDQLDQRQKILFWIYYPEARSIFATYSVYNPNNQAGEITFDDVFFQRKFDGYVFQESNVYENRRIEQYTTGLEVLLESERVKERIFNFEHDLWEY
ncbi:MAG: gliding motility protein GldN [Bacteroidota bacterium]|nr:gliding motility protein GldN [Bacteroidota bacterium]